MKALVVPILSLCILISCHETTNNQEAEIKEVSELKAPTLIDLRDPASLAQEKPILIAHRGGVVNDSSPENSLMGIKLAAERGYNMLEVDIRQAKDGALIAFHDRNLMSDVGIDNSIEEMNTAEIAQLTYKGTEERILSLDEFLKSSTELGMGIMLDIKTTEENRNDSLLFKGIAELLKKYGLEKSTVTISGAPMARKYLKGLAIFGMSGEEKEQIINGNETIRKDLFWFGLPAQIEDDEIKALNEKSYLVIPAINIFRYPNREEDLDLAKKDTERLLKAGVDGFQIDSFYDQVFLE